MFKIADESFENKLRGLAADEPLLCRVASLYESYPPPLGFVDYWTIINDKTGAVVGVAARNGADLVLCLTDGADIDETCAFVCAVGARRVFCGAKYGLVLPEYSRAEGYVLKRSKPYSNTGGADFCVPGLKEVYALLKSCEDNNFKVPAFEDFYVDMNHRLRHGTARICAVNSDAGELAAVSMTVAESADCAVLGAVACRPDLQRSGYGSRAVAEITNRLIRDGKTVYLHRAADENREFYESLGFKQAGMWAEFVKTV